MSLHEVKIDYYFTKIKKIISKYSRVKLIEFFTKRTIDSELSIPKNEMQPWICLALLEWSIIYGKTNFCSKKINDFHLKNLNSYCIKIVDHSNIFENTTPISIYLKTLAHQQFIFQKPLENFSFDFVRLKIMLVNSISGKKHIENLEKDTEFSFNEIFNILICIYSVIREQRMFKFSDTTLCDYRKKTGEIVHMFDNNKLKKLFDIFSQTTASFKEHRSKKQYDLFSTSFNRYPLLKINNEYYCPSKKLFFNSLEQMIMDEIQSSEGKDFMSEFGKNVFEPYINYLLENSNIDFTKEKEIKSLIKAASGINSSSCIDFMIKEGNNFIFIEAKSFNISPYTKYSNVPEEIQQSLETSIGKALDQIKSTITGLKISENFYSIIVTRANTYLENNLADIFPDEQLNKKTFILSIDAFEKLLEAFSSSSSKKKITDYFDFINAIKTKGHAYNFIEKNLHSFFDVSCISPKHLKVEYDEIMKKFDEKFFKK